MFLGKLPVPGRPTIEVTVVQGPIALVVGAGGGCWTFLLSSIRSLLFLPLSEILSQRADKPKTTNRPNPFVINV